MPRFRKNQVFPRHVSDIGAFIFVLIMIPFTFVYELHIVLPVLYKEAFLRYLIHLAIGGFLFLNLVGNFFGLWLVDTSTRYVVLPSTKNCSKWKLCAVCEAVTPPRAWHCSICNTCILKREHHCMFVGYCVGHQNHRYFCLFLLYLWISAMYFSYFNTLFLSLHVDELTWSQIVKFVFPLVILITGIDLSWIQLYIFFWSIHFAVVLLTTVLVLYHSSLILSGKTTVESNHKVYIYNLGWRQNLIEVFGQKWGKAFIWPFAKSVLPHNGVDWDTTETWTADNPKNR